MDKIRIERLDLFHENQEMQDHSVDVGVSSIPTFIFPASDRRVPFGPERVVLVPRVGHQCAGPWAAGGGSGDHTLQRSGCRSFSIIIIYALHPITTV